MSATKLQGDQLSLIPADADLAVMPTTSPAFARIDELHNTPPFQIGDKVRVSHAGMNFDPRTVDEGIVKAVYRIKRLPPVRHLVPLGSWRCRVKFEDGTRTLWDRQIRKV